MRPPQANLIAGNEVKGAPSTSDRQYRSEKEPHRDSIKTFTMESLLAPIQDALEGQIVSSWVSSAPAVWVIVITATYAFTSIYLCRVND